MARDVEDADPAADLRGHPQARIIEAVASGEIDAALVWGPIAGPLARLQDVPLALADVQPRIDGPTLPMMFDISMDLRREDIGLRREVEAALISRRTEIDAILAEVGVPRLDVVRAAAPAR